MSSSHSARLTQRQDGGPGECPAGHDVARSRCVTISTTTSDAPTTVDGRPVALLTPIVGRMRWMPRETFLHTVLAHQADPALRRDLDSLAPDTTDELPR